MGGDVSLSTFSACHDRTKRSWVLFPADEPTIPVSRAGYVSALHGSTATDTNAAPIEHHEPVKWSPLANVSWPCPHEEAKAGHEDLALRAGLTAGAAPSLPGGKVCR